MRAESPSARKFCSAPTLPGVSVFSIIVAWRNVYATMAGSRTHRPPGSAGEGRAKPRSAARSLGAALREAGLGEAAPLAREAETVETPPVRSYGAELSSAIAAVRPPPLAVFETDDAPGPAAQVIRRTTPTTQGVVSPPPWLRAARRGRWQSRMMNTFGWVMTLAIAGSIIGLAGHYLGISPALLQTTMQARQ